MAAFATREAYQAMLDKASKLGLVAQVDEVIGDRYYVVPSRSRPADWHMILRDEATGELSCDCMAFAFTHACTHAAAVWLWRVARLRNVSRATVRAGKAA